MDKEGNLYGTTASGGNSGYPSGYGIVFKLDASGNETVLYEFKGPATGGAGAAGAHPYASLVIDKAGNIYGVTNAGGTNGFGTVFKVDTSGRETVLHSFAGPQAGGPGADGAYPRAGLVADKIGNLYGTT